MGAVYAWYSPAVPESAANILASDALKSVAEAACASRALEQFTESRVLYPSDVDPAEAERLHTSLCSLLESALTHEVLAGVRLEWSPFPFASTSVPPLVGLIFALCISLAAETFEAVPDFDDPDSLLSTIRRTYAGLLKHISPALREVVDRVDEIMIFDMKIPDPVDPGEYSDERRAIKMFGEYWDAYRAILNQFGSADMGYQPHPMLRFIVSLQYRLREYGSRFGDERLLAALENVLEVPFNTDTGDGFEDLVQPLIDALSLAWEESRVSRSSGAFALTGAEQRFLSASSVSLRGVRRRTNAAGEAMFARARAAAEADQVSEAESAASPAAREKPAPRFLPDVVDVVLTDEESREAADEAFLIRTPIIVTGEVTARGNVVRSEGRRSTLANADFLLFLYLVEGLWTTKDGYLKKRPDDEPGTLTSLDGVPKEIEPALSRLRTSLGEALGAETAARIVQSNLGRARLATYRRYVVLNREALTQHDDQRIRAVAKRLPPEAFWRSG